MRDSGSRYAMHDLRTDEAHMKDFQSESGLQKRIRSGLFFDVDPWPSQLPVSYSAKTGEATRYALAHMAILRWRREKDQALATVEDRALVDFANELNGVHAYGGGYADMAVAELDRLERSILDSLRRAPLNIEGYNMLSGVLLTLDRHEDAIAITEPIIATLIDLLPKDRTFQAPYGAITNRPFFRLLLNHVLALHALGKHRAASQFATLGKTLWPGDNIGFRFLNSRSKRDRAREHDL